MVLRNYCTKRLAMNITGHDGKMGGMRNQNEGPLSGGPVRNFRVVIPWNVVAGQFEICWGLVCARADEHK